MIFLQVSSYTDWIQAVAAIIASIGAVVGFILLIIDSKEKQSQINVLTNLATESKEQTIHLASQVDQMIKGNKLQNDFVSLFQRYVLSNDKSLDTQIRFQLLERKKRKQDIQPIFSISSQSFNYGIFELVLMNDGKQANNVDVINDSEDSVMPSITTKPQDGIVNFKHGLRIVISDNPVPIDTVQNIQIKIIFTNDDKNKYFQIIDGCYNDKLIIHPPEEIIEPN